MNDSSKLNIKQTQQLLNKSCETIEPAIQAKLDSARVLALEELNKPGLFKFKLWHPALALAVPMVLIAHLSLPFNPKTEEIETDIYADIEILLDEEEMDFLNDMEISEWLMADTES